MDGKMDAQIPIPVFKPGSAHGETAYDTWKYKFMLLLEVKNCKECVEQRERPENIKLEEWQKKQVKAKMLLSSAVDVEFIMECETAYDMIQKLDNLYMKKSEARQALIEKKLSRLRFDEKDDPEKFFDAFERLIKDLKNAGATVDRKRKLAYLMIALPDSLDHITETIDLLPEADRNVDYVREKLLLRREVKKQDEVDKKTTDERHDKHVFLTNVEKITCYKCYRKGHIAKDCTSERVRGRGSYRRGFRGYNRGGTGNYRQDNYEENADRGNSRGYGRGFNRGNRFQRNYRGRWNHNDSNQASNNITEVSNVNSFSVEVNTSSKVGSPESENVVTWILDSGCTNHIINDDKYYYKSLILKNPVYIKVGNGNKELATKIGNIQCILNGSVIDIKNVYFSEKMKKNLLSVSCITSNNNVVVYANDIAEIYNQNNELLAIGRKQNGLYEIQCNVNVDVESNMLNMFSKKEKFHKLLGHVNFQDLIKMCKEKVVLGLPQNLESGFIDCEICMTSKMTRKSFHNNRYRAQSILEIIHTDLKGPFDVDGYDGSKYFVLFLDDYSHLVAVYCIKTKDEVFNCFESYCKYMMNLTGKRIIEIRCDNGTEYINSRFYKLARELGFRLRPSPAYEHQLNGTSERCIRTLMDRARCLRKEAGLSKEFWPEIVQTAAYLGNRLLSSATYEKLCPYEIFFGKKPCIDNLKMYGCKAFVHVPEELRKTQDDKGKEGVLVGYSDVGYRILIEKKVIVARSVRFIEKEKSFVNVNDQISNCDEDNEEEEPNLERKDSGVENDVRRSMRERKLPMKYNDFELYANTCGIEVPYSYAEAVERSDAKYWLEAMERELTVLEDTNTWKLVDRPPDKSVLELKWVFTKKSEDLYKARIVVKGFQQDVLNEDIYSPVARMCTLKLLLAIACKRGFLINQLDFEAAFLNGKIESEVYVEQPEGFKINNEVYRLEKALYGLRESPRRWYSCFNNYMLKLGFKNSQHDQCLYVNNDKTIYIVIFVDDMLICAEDENQIKSLKHSLSETFKVKDLGSISKYLGIDVVYDKDKRKMTLNQSMYIELLASKYRILESNKVNTPMEAKLKLKPSEKETDPNIKFRNIIGALLYVGIGTRPDIIYAVNYLSRFQSCYDSTHYKYALRVLIYLYHTRNFKLHFDGGFDDCIIRSYVDSDWAADLEDCKSTEGFVIKRFCI